MNDTAFDTPPVLLRPAVDAAFFGRGDFELLQEEYRAVVRVRPRGRSHPAHALPPLLEDMPTQPLEVALPGVAAPWRLPEDLIPTEWMGLPSPLEVLPRAAMEAPSRRRDQATGQVTARHRVGTFPAFTDPLTVTWDGISVAPWEDESVPRWRTVDLLGLPAIVTAAAALWAAVALFA